MFLFYSKYCNHSKELLDLLDDNLSKFDMVCVDKKNGIRNPLVKKYNVLSVPSVFVEGELLTGRSLWDWVTPKSETSPTKVEEKELLGFSKDFNFQPLEDDNKEASPFQLSGGPLGAVLGENKLEQKTGSSQNVPFKPIDSRKINNNVSNDYEKLLASRK